MRVGTDTTRVPPGSRAGLLGLLLIVWVCPASSESWPMHGHDAQRTCRSTVDGPLSNALRWTYDFTADRLQDNACPIVGSDGTVYAVTEGALYAVKSDGVLKWKKAGFGARHAPALSPDQSVIYVGSLAALKTLDGSLLWQDSLGRVTYSSLAVDGSGTIYVGTGGPAVFAVNPNGSVKWKYSPNAKAGVEAPVALDRTGNVYFSTITEGLFAVGPTGNYRWGFSHPAYEYWFAPAFGGDGTVFFPTECGIRAFSAAGSQKWYSGASRCMSVDGVFISVAVSDANSALYSARREKETNGSTRACFLNATGSVRGNTVSDFPIVDTTRNYVVPPGVGNACALSGNGVYYSTWDASFGSQGVVSHVATVLSAVSISDGTIIWQYEFSSDGQYWSTQSPALGPDGTLYAVSSGALERMMSARLYAFYTTPSVPKTPMLLWPPDELRNIPVDTIALRWKTIGSFIHQVQVATDRLFQNTVFDRDSTRGYELAFARPADDRTYYWRVRARNRGGVSNWSNTWSFSTAMAVGLAAKQRVLFPDGPSIGPRSIRYRLFQDSRVSIRICDVQGRTVGIICDAYQKSGDFEAPIEMRELPSGMYLLLFKAGTGSGFTIALPKY